MNQHCVLNGDAQEWIRSIFRRDLNNFLAANVRFDVANAVVSLLGEALFSLSKALGLAFRLGLLHAIHVRFALSDSRGPLGRCSRRSSLLLWSGLNLSPGGRHRP